jgi:hypothetical protein
MNRIPLSIRINPALKAAAEKVAVLEHRSLTNLIEILLEDRCKKHKIKVERAS